MYEGITKYISRLRIIIIRKTTINFEDDYFRGELHAKIRSNPFRNGTGINTSETLLYVLNNRR